MRPAQALAALDELSEPTLVLLADRDGDGDVVDLVVDYVNGAACAATGLQPDALRGRRVRAALPRFPRELLEQLAGVLEHGQPLRTTVSLDDRLQDGAPFAVRLEIAASALGESLLVVCEDVVARQRTAATERRYGAVLEATSDWVSIADGDGTLVYINAAGRRMVGIDLDEDITGLPIGAFSPAWARDFARRQALPIARREGVWRGDLARLHRDGHEIPISQVIVARTTPDGEVDFYATIARDMTRERAAEAALRESEERFRIAFEQAPIGVSLIDLTGRYVQLNDAYCRTARRSREELVAAGPEAITHPDDVAFGRYAMRLLIDDGLPTFRFEQRYVDPLGDPIWVEISASLLRDAERRPQFVIHMVQDLGERRIAHTLQRSMLTTRLPEIDGVELAVRYLPGMRETEVGGDWYDVIPLPDGRVGVVIGDVVGRGIEAAATMSQLRTALRAYAVEGHEPAVVVAKLNRLVDHLRVGIGTTLVLLDFDPLTREMRYVSAGHMPALLVAADGASHFLDGARSTPLGTADGDGRPPQGELLLEPGDAVLLYTDGLVERRDVGLDARLAKLRGAVADAPADLRRTLEHLTTELGCDDALRQDDVALLALRLAAVAVTPLVVAFDADPARLGELRRELREWLAAAGAGAREASDVLVAVGEACANAIEHAGRAPGSPIEVSAQLVGREVVVRVRDHGSWRAPDPPGERGQGLRIMRALTDAVEIVREADGTRVELRRRLATRSPAVVEEASDERAAATPEMQLSVDHDGEVAIAHLRGEVDVSHSAVLAGVLAQAVTDHDRGLVLNLRAVDYLDSAGLHLLYDTARVLGARGQQLRVVAAPDGPVLRLLALVELERSLPLDATQAAAVAALAGSADA